MVSIGSDFIKILLFAKVFPLQKNIDFGLPYFPMGS